MRMISKQKGFTLVEAMMAAIVLSIAAAGVLMPFTAGARSRMEGQRRTLAAILASDLMEKIIATDFDNIDDRYGSYSEAEGEIKDMTGAEFTDPMYAGFSRTADCNEVYVSQESGTDDPIFIRATVKVYYRDAEIASVSRLISK